MKKKLTRPMCLALALVVLSGALIATAFTGSPYDTLKKSLFDLTHISNGTVETYIEMSINGKVLSSETSKMSYGDNSYVSYGSNYGTYSNDVFDLSFNSNNSDSTYSVYERFSPYNAVGRSLFSAGIDLKPGSAAYNFASLAVDMLAGNLKNNVTMSTDGKIKQLSGTLTAAQVPEIYNAALTFILSQSTAGDYRRETISSTDTKEVYKETRYNGDTKTVTVVSYDRVMETYYLEDGTPENYYTLENEKIISTEELPVTAEDYANVYDQPVKSLVIDYVHGVAHIGEDGYISDLNAEVVLKVTTIFGEKYEISGKLSLTLSDVGKADPECPVKDAETVFTKEFFEENGHYARFTLNPDGTVDKNSIRIAKDDEYQKDLIPQIKDEP